MITSNANLRAAAADRIETAYAIYVPGEGYLNKNFSPGSLLAAQPFRELDNGELARAVEEFPEARFVGPFRLTPWEDFAECQL